MGNINDVIREGLEYAICNDNQLCVAERDAKGRGGWFFQIYFLGYKPLVKGDLTITIAGTFEVLEFSPTLLRLNQYDEDAEHQLNESAAAIHTMLDMINSSESMAFMKMPDSFSMEIEDARLEHRPISLFKFSLKKFSRSGGVLYKYDLRMKSVFILDVQRNGATEKVLITYSKSRLDGSVPAEN